MPARCHLFLSVPSPCSLVAAEGIGKQRKNWQWGSRGCNTMELSCLPFSFGFDVCDRGSGASEEGVVARWHLMEAEGGDFSPFPQHT